MIVLLVSRSGLVEKNAVKVFHHYGVHLSSFLLDVKLRHFRENNNVVGFTFSFHTFMPLAYLRWIHLQGYFPTWRTRGCRELYPFIRPSRRPLALDRGIILIPVYIRSSPTLLIHDVVPSLKMRPEGISHTSLVLIDCTILFTVLSMSLCFKLYLDQQIRLN